MSEDFFSNESSSDGGSLRFLKYLVKEKMWMVGEDSVDLSYVQVDVETMKTGIGRYSGGYEFEWSPVFGSRLYKDGWSDAVSVWLMIHGEDKPVLLETMAGHQVRAFKSMYEQIRNDFRDNLPNLPVFSYKGSETFKTKSGYDSASHTFKLEGYKPRKDGFVVPEWFKEEAAVDAEVTKTEELKSEDIPF